MSSNSSKTSFAHQLVQCILQKTTALSWLQCTQKCRKSCLPERNTVSKLVSL